MDKWKASVEAVQRITRQGGLLNNISREYTATGEGPFEPTEEHVLEDDGLLGQPAKVAIRWRAGAFGDGLFLYARPREVDVKEQQEDAKANDGGLFVARLFVSGRVVACLGEQGDSPWVFLCIHRIDLGLASTYCEANAGTPRSASRQSMAVLPSVFRHKAISVGGGGGTHLGLNQDQVDEQDNVVMLDIFVAEAAAILAHRQADVVAAGPGPQRLNRMTAFYADRHWGAYTLLYLSWESERVGFESCQSRQLEQHFWRRKGWQCMCSGVVCRKEKCRRVGAVRY